MMRIAQTETGKPVRIPMGAVEIEGRLVLARQQQVLLVCAGPVGGFDEVLEAQLLERLEQQGYGLLLCDLLTEEEVQLDAETKHLSSDESLLAGRLQLAAEWVRRQPGVESSSIVFYGAGIYGAGVLMAASHLKEAVAGVVCLDPDWEALLLEEEVEAPTLLLTSNGEGGEAVEEALRGVDIEVIQVGDEGELDAAGMERLEQWLVRVA